VGHPAATGYGKSVNEVEEPGMQEQLTLQGPPQETTSSRYTQAGTRQPPLTSNSGDLATGTLLAQ